MTNNIWRDERTVNEKRRTFPPSGQILKTASDRIGVIGIFVLRVYHVYYRNAEKGFAASIGLANNPIIGGQEDASGDTQRVVLGTSEEAYKEAERIGREYIEQKEKHFRHLRNVARDKPFSPQEE